MLLAGDIGGTTVRLALHKPKDGPRHPVVEEEFKSADFAKLEEACQAFLQRHDAKPDVASFSVAGPVVESRAHLTNLGWDVEQGALAQALGVKRALLLNDLACMAHALPHLQPDETTVINRGEAVHRTAIAVVAPGTGLGEAFLVWESGRYIVCPSEGGHGDFAPSNALQAELWAFLAKRHGHVSYERVCSGTGLPDVYDFVRSKHPDREPAAFRETLAAAASATPLIVEAGLDPGHPLAHEALRIFVEVLAAEASNLALKVLATGGVFLAGGLPPRLMPLLKAPAFMKAFTARGRFKDLLRKVPVEVVTVNAALLGAAIYGLDVNRTAQARG